MSARVLDLPLRDPFTIARSSRTAAHNVLVELSWRGLTGYGEAAPSTYYGEHPASVLAALDRLGPELGDDPYALDAIVGRWDRTLRGNPAARAALEMALLDLIGKDCGRPVWRIWGLDPATMPRTSFTIGINTPDAMARKAAAAAEYPILKVKVGTGRDHENLAAIRAVRSEATIRVDANAAWTARDAIANVEPLLEFGLEFVEQPVAANDLAGLRFVRERLPVPVFADESCLRPEDLPRLAGVVDGVVLKVAKHGGPVATRRLAEIARALGLQIMIGCMVESSLGIAAGCLVGPLADHADLDGNLLLAADPFRGLELVDGRWHLPAEPGLGVAIFS
ncbi:MAG TPA: dipeptide epimerase [Dehalococcoidia bacterium]|nr:dipeptide epimerase [Dehalococcoidia bacterium]